MIPTANPTPAQLAAMEAESARIWAQADEQPYRRDGRDEFEPVEPDMSDPGHEGADLLEARETAWREGLR